MSDRRSDGAPAETKPPSERATEAGCVPPQPTTGYRTASHWIDEPATPPHERAGNWLRGRDLDLLRSGSIGARPRYIDLGHGNLPVREVARCPRGDRSLARKPLCATGSRR